MYSILAMGWFILPNCGNGGGGNTPIDNSVPIDNICIIEFTQTPVYSDNTLMSSTPDREISGYYLYVCHIISGVPGNMVWIAEINNPLKWEKDAWRGSWDIRNLLYDNTSLIYGTSPDGLTAFSLKAVSIRVDEKGNPFVSDFSVPWVYSITPYPLDNQTLHEGDIYATDINGSGPINMDFGIGGNNK